MFNIGDAVIHPMFPDWGKGIVTAIIIDTVTNKTLIKVMWQSLNADKLAYHSLDHLVRFVDSPTSFNP